MVGKHFLTRLFLLCCSGSSGIKRRYVLRRGVAPSASKRRVGLSNICIRFCSASCIALVCCGVTQRYLLHYIGLVLGWCWLGPCFCCSNGTAIADAAASLDCSPLCSRHSSWLYNQPLLMLEDWRCCNCCSCWSCKSVLQNAAASRCCRRSRNRCCNLVLQSLLQSALC